MDISLTVSDPVPAIANFVGKNASAYRAILIHRIIESLSAADILEVIREMGARSYQEETLRSSEQDSEVVVDFWEVTSGSTENEGPTTKSQILGSPQKARVGRSRRSASKAKAPTSTMKQKATSAQRSNRSISKAGQRQKANKRKGRETDS